MAMGGPAKFFVAARTERELVGVLDFAKRVSLPWYVVGAGTNLIVSDKGYRGIVIVNQIREFYHQGNVVKVGAGNELLGFIAKLNGLGLRGLEKMAGIPGTVGGAIYGCAGAYGQEIKDRLLKVRFFDGRKFRSLNKAQCRFGYRTSIFKQRKHWIITEATFKLGVGERRKLSKMSLDTIKLRAKKYWPGLLCPGSFFKNIKLSDIKPARARKAFLEKIDQEKIQYGKLPAGYLLEEIGAKGMKQGTIKVTSHHANLIFNPGKGKAADVARLANRLKRLVKKKFGITIEEEVQYLGP